MFINIRHNRAFQENLKKNFFANNFLVPELYTLKFLTQKEPMVMEIFAALPSQKSYIKKIIVFTFYQLVPTSHVQLRSLN